MSSARQGASDHAHGTCDPATCPECAAYAEQESEAPSTAKEAPPVDSDGATGATGPGYPPRHVPGPLGTAWDEYTLSDAEWSERIEAAHAKLAADARCPTCERPLSWEPRCLCGAP